MAEDEAFANELSKLLKAAGDTYKASLKGDGAIAQGTNAKAVRQRRCDDRRECRRAAILSQGTIISNGERQIRSLRGWYDR